MADKEERILIDIIQPGLNCVYRMHNDPKGLSLCKHNGEEEPVSEKDCNNCLEGMTRQEAIEKMAKAICLFKDDCHCEGKCLNECFVWEYDIPLAEAALNAFLGVEK